MGKVIWHETKWGWNGQQWDWLREATMGDDMMCVRCGLLPAVRVFICANCLHDDYERAADEAAALREALAALVEERDAGTFWHSRHQAQTCTYCRAENTEAGGWVDVPHTSDCPITRGRALLAKGAGEILDGVDTITRRKAQIEAYEQQFQMTSAEFLALWEAGQAPDTYEHQHWHDLLMRGRGA